MKNNIVYYLLTLAMFIVGCHKDSTFDGPKIEVDNKPYFYVRYHGDHWATVQHDKHSTMTITDENGQQQSYSIGSRDVIIGPVYAGLRRL